jgi:hypothetical protein
MAILLRTNTDANNFLDAAGIARTEANGSIVIGICQLTTDLKNYGLWDKMKAIYPMVGQAGVSSSFQFNLKDPSTFRGTFSGGWIFSSTGATPDGSTGYMDTKLNLLSNYSNVLSNHFSVYYRTGDSSNEKIGAQNGSTFSQGMSAHLNWFGTYYNDNMGRTALDSATYGTSNAMHLSSVTLPSTQKMYRNGILRINGSTDNSTYPSLNFYFGANNNGTANSFSSRELAFASIGDGLTNTEATNFYTAVQRFQTTLGRQV